MEQQHTHLSRWVHRWRYWSHERVDEVRLRILREAPYGIRESVLFEGQVEANEALWFAPTYVNELTSPCVLAEQIPDLSVLANATLVIAPYVVSTTKKRFRWFQKELFLSRAIRGSALLIKGFHSIEGDVDSQSKLDLIWGKTRSEL